MAMSMIAELFDAAVESLGPLWVELSFLLFFSLGFIFLRKDTFRRQGAKKVSTAQGVKVRAAMPVRADSKWKKSLDAAASTCNNSDVLSTWRAEQKSMPTPKDLMKPVIQAFLDAEPDALLPEIMDHIRQHKETLSNVWTATSILDTVARAGKVKLMEKLWSSFSEESMSKNASMFEVVLGGFASAGQPEKVKEYKAMLRQANLKLSPRGYSLIIKGYLKNSLVDEVLANILEMCKDGQQVPGFAVAQFLRVSIDTGKTSAVYQVLKDNQIPMQSDAISVILEGCSRQKDPKMAKLAKQVEMDARAAKVEFSLQAYDSLLKTYAQDCDQRVFDIFREMQQNGHSISEGLCVGLLARCADAKFLSFAEEIIRFVQAGSGMSIALYSALMKVYAYSGMYDKACNLYAKIKEDGLEPDAMMYGCLMKFAVECGRTKLSQTLADKVPHMDIQNYMSLIRAAGRDRDVNRAFGVIKQLRQGGMVADAAAYNCVVDVCIQAGDMARAKELVREMKKLGLLDVITYNTFLKGFCAQGDLKGSKAVLVEMESEGLTPNDVSYNCILNTAVCNGNLYEAWDVIDKMEAANIRPDRYTLSIMMKAMKKVHNAKDLNRCFELLERSKIDPCSDEILMNTVLETCTKHRDYDRMESLLVRFEKSNLRPAVPTYGSIIKAFSSLKRPEKCWQYWEDMQNQRGLVPNDIVFGCMLDALVCNGLVEQAVELFQQTPLTKNAVLYSILIKGFANSQQPGRAMDCFWDMKKQGLKMNTVTYNSIIDSQARPGKMEEVSELLSHMAAEGCRPDAITHSTVVKGYCVRGDMDTALKVIREMQREKLPHDAVIYNTILDGCTRHKRMDIVDEILKSMDEQGVRPTNFTLGIIVKLYSRNKQLDLAFRAMETTPKRGNFVANAQVWTCLMCACLTNHEPDKAVKVFHDMKFAGQAPDSKTCTSLITGLIRARRYQQAVHMVEEIYNFGKGVAKGRNNCVELDCLESLLAVLVQEGYKEELAKPLLDKLLAAKVPVSGTLMACAFEMGPQGKGGPRSKASAPRGGKGNYRRA
mmetsp:Transcript_13146/g.23247  ORF Transcript_13146/g.23247 Transcript_13146/m.23247 type:complete len:1050 (-) Transcript_13146:71-3220(-)